MLVGFFIAGIICIVALTRSSDVENEVNTWDDVGLYAGIASGVLFALTLGSPASD